MDETITEKDLDDLFWVFGTGHTAAALASNMNNPPDRSLTKTQFQRTTDFLTHPVFSRYVVIVFQDGFVVKKITPISRCCIHQGGGIPVYIVPFSATYPL